MKTDQPEGEGERGLPMEEEEEEDWKEEEDVEGRWIDVESLFIRRSRMHTITACMIDAYSQILHRRNETCLRSIL